MVDLDLQVPNTTAWGSARATASWVATRILGRKKGGQAMEFTMDFTIENSDLVTHDGSIVLPYMVT
jgi:hypothetical protein